MNHPNEALNADARSSHAVREKIENGIARELGIDPNDLPGFLSEEQTAKILDVKNTTLRVWRVTGRNDLAFVKTGRCPRYPLESVIDFLAQRVRTATGG